MIDARRWNHQLENKKSYCSRWAGQYKGTGDVAVLNWVQMKKTARQSENTNRKPGKEITSGAS